MLLRRIIEHVKAQNWFAVSLDFVMVVAGVFIGLQVQQWNEARKDAVQHERLLERLAEEFRDLEPVAAERHKALIGYGDAHERLERVYPGATSVIFAPGSMRSRQVARLW